MKRAGVRRITTKLSVTVTDLERQRTSAERAPPLSDPPLPAA